LEWRKASAGAWCNDIRAAAGLKPAAAPGNANITAEGYLSNP